MVVVVLEQCRVAPPPGTVADSSFPLTFLDIMFLNFPPVQSLIFYEFPKCSNTHFKETIVPNLKYSLSLALQHFFPIAGNLVIPSNNRNSTKPVTRYVNGDSVSLTFAESTSDFYHLTGNHERDADEFYGLVPKIPLPTKVFKEEILIEKVIPLLALQVTLFPNVGICLGFTYDHVIVDGRSFSNFISSWAWISKLGGPSPSPGSEGGIGISLPFHDRTVISDPDGVGSLFLNQLGYYGNNAEDQAVFKPLAITNKVRAMFLIPGSDIQILKELVLTRQAGKELNRMSSFTVTCAYLWVCWVKSSVAVTEEDDGDMEESFVFVADCRGRTYPRIPEAYFGNCLAPCHVTTTRGMLMREDGILIAAELIGESIAQRFLGGPFKDANGWISDVKTLKFEQVLSVAGSPKLRMYETDFGWGKPKKREFVSIDFTGAMSMSECRDSEEGGGLEIGLSLLKNRMTAFSSIFYKGLETIRDTDNPNRA